MKTTVRLYLFFIGILLLLTACASVQMQPINPDLEEVVWEAGYDAMFIYLVHNPGKADNAEVIINSLSHNIIDNGADLRYMVQKITAYVSQEMIRSDNLEWYLVIRSATRLFIDKLGVNYDLPENFAKSKALIESFLLGMESAIEDINIKKFEGELG